MALSSQAEGQQEKDDSERYDAGEGPEALAQKLVDGLTISLGKSQGEGKVDELSPGIRKQIIMYLADYGEWHGLSVEQRTRAIDAEALLYALKEARARSGLDRRIVDVLSDLFENAVHEAARNRLSRSRPQFHQI
jgi:hypothetical protein